MIKGNERAKVQRTVNDVSAARFDERDIDHLFMSLRAHCGHYKIFREVADFVAHNEIRDKGITNQSLEAFYLSFRYFSEYVSPKRALDIGMPFPAYIVKLMKYQVDKCDEARLCQEFNVTKSRLKSRIDNLFKIDNKARTACLAKQLSDSNLRTLQHILGFIGSHPAYTQDEIISELIGVLNANMVDFDRSAVLAQGDRIMLCILALVHESEYNFKGHKNGYCNISCETTALPHGVTYVDEQGNPVKIEQSYGRLQISGHVVVVNSGKEVTVAYPIITTNLDVEEWCGESLFSIEKRDGGMLFRKIRFDGPIGVSENFHLTSADA
jgi:hypothetical protein